MQPGEIYRIPDFYLDPDTGALCAKYLLMLALYPHGDAVGRLLTSRSHGRPEHPRCYHGTPYPGFFLGIPGGFLAEPTWIDLRTLEDIDSLDMTNRIARGAALVQTIPRAMLADAIDCVAAADDTTRGQEKALRNFLAAIRG